MKISDLKSLPFENRQEPVSLVGYFTISQSFAYITQEPDAKGRADAVVIPGSVMYDICSGLGVPIYGGSLVLFSASGKATGLLGKYTGMSLFPYFLTSITEVKLKCNGSDYAWTKST